MRCLYCHNPDTWEMNQNNEVSSDDIVKQVLKYQNYYGDTPKITVTGGEPLLQIDFLIDLFTKCKQNGIDTCLDTSGITYEETDIDKYKALIAVCDLVLLDIKHPNSKKHKMISGHENTNVLAFLSFLNEMKQPTWIRYVVVPKISDDLNDIRELKTILNNYSNITNIEVLPYHKMGIPKYEALGIKYPLVNVDTPTENLIKQIKDILLEDINYEI